MIIIKNITGLIHLAMTKKNCFEKKFPEEDSCGNSAKET